MNQNTINCPNCATEINVSDILYHQLQEKISKDFEEKNARKDKEVQDKLKDILAEKEKLILEKEAMQQKVDAEVKTKLNAEKLKLEKALREGLNEEKAEEIESLKKELDQKSLQVKELNKTRADIERLKREKEELRDLVSLEKELEFSDKLRDEKQKIKKQVDEASSLKIKELEMQLEVQRNLAEEMKRKAEQGSMQLQGEVQELAIEEILLSMFPFDLIAEVGKGVKGADVIHTVRNKIGADCGKIIYESKRTKSFSPEWIKKLKTDAVAIRADIAIIITEAMPEGLDRIGLQDGVWICTFHDFKGLVLALRESLIKINEAFESQTNKGEKMQMLYDYLTSNEFRHQIGAVIEGFTDLQESYIKERRAMERIWKEREKQLEKVLLNTNHFIGSIKGIAGSSIPDLKQIGAGDNILEIEE